VDHDHVAVAGEAHVQLHAVRAFLGRQAKGGQGVFRRGGAGAAVA
jgi:hypothetical protein